MCRENKIIESRGGRGIGRERQRDWEENGEGNPPPPLDSSTWLSSTHWGVHGADGVGVFARCVSIIIRGTPPFLFRGQDYSDFLEAGMQFVWLLPHIFKGGKSCC